MSTHKAFVATSAGVLGETTRPTPRPGIGEVLVHVAYTALIPLDVEIGEKGFLGPDAYPYVPGFTVAGTVAQLGEGVDSALLAVGEKVAGYPIPSYGSAAKGAQEYAVLPAHAVGKLSANVALDDAATIPDNFVCAWWTLTEYLKLPLKATKCPQPFADASFVVYGAGSTTGQFVLQLLAHSGCTRVIAVASRTAPGATSTIDYRQADWPQQILAANGGAPVDYALDTIATEASLRGLAQTVGAQSKVAILLPIKIGQAKLVAQAEEAGAQLLWDLPAEKNAFPEGVKLEYVRTFLWDQNEELKENLMTRILPQLLESGAVKPTAKKLIDAPTESLGARVKAGLDLLKSNSLSGCKVIIKV